MLRCIADINFVQFTIYFCSYKMSDCISQIMNIVYTERSIQYTYRCVEHLLKKKQVLTKTTTEFREGKKKPNANTCQFLSISYLFKQSPQKSHYT